MSQDIFGASGMGYVVIESERMEPWKRFLEGGIGLHCHLDESDCLAFRMDTHERRIIVQRGQAEDITAVGWHMENEKVLNVVLQRLRDRGIEVTLGSKQEAAQRGVRQFWRLVGPKRMLIELFFEPVTTSEPLKMLCADFITGDHGMGHLAITSRRPDAMKRFWTEVFDARHSDSIVEQMAGVTLDIDFLRVNPRHHSIAIARVRGLPIDPIRTRVQHMNLLTTSVSELTNAFLRCRELGFEMAHEIGEHPNDREQSFYVLSPSGFEVELGWNALVVDEATWQPTTYKGISLWGHKPPRQSQWQKITGNIGNFAQGLRSMRRPEYSPLEELKRS